MFRELLREDLAVGAGVMRVFGVVFQAGHRPFQADEERACGGGR